MRKEKEFIAIFTELEHIVNSRATWETKYDLCFGWKHGIYPRMVKNGTELRGYVDPDTTYQEDVMTLWRAARDTVKELERRMDQYETEEQNDTTY